MVSRIPNRSLRRPTGSSFATSSGIRRPYRIGRRSGCFGNAWPQPGRILRSGWSSSGNLKYKVSPSNAVSAGRLVHHRRSRTCLCRHLAGRSSGSCTNSISSWTKTTSGSLHDSRIDLSHPGETVYRNKGSFGVKPQASMDRTMHRRPAVVSSPSGRTG